MQKILNIVAGLAVMLLALLIVAMPAAAAPAKVPVWEVVNSVDPDNATPAAEGPSRIDISVRDGLVYITVDADVKVEV